MVKKPTTVRFSEATRQKLDVLTARYGTQSETLAIAIDRLYQAEVQTQIVEQQVSVLFADIRGFSRFSRDLAPDRVFAVLNRYLSLAGEGVAAQGGTLGTYMGDALMAFFNGPLPQPDRTLNAIRAALAIREAVAAYNAKQADHDPLQFGIGVHTGQAVVGNLGTAGQKQHTVIGETVNLAYLLHERAAEGQILLSQAAYDAVRGAVVIEAAGPLSVRGRTLMVETYSLVTLSRP